ncbi:MAG: hypothetical protein P8P29_08815 [Flavobacteriaceae bacterium]|nr:hypothetical protein [Flavobacteriaceae bacterium]
MKQSVKVNSSLKNKLKSLEDTVENKLDTELRDIAVSAVGWSPVDTGSYVTSFSYSLTQPFLRSVNSEGKPKGQSRGTFVDRGLSDLMSDLNSIDLMSSSSIILSNGSPHATDVETGSGWRNTNGYLVFGKIRREYG